MRIGSRVGRGWVRLGRNDFQLSEAARRRLRWMDYYRECGGNARLVCRHFDISPQTFYRWLRRYSSRDPSTLEERSRRPRHLRASRVGARPWSGRYSSCGARIRAGARTSWRCCCAGRGLQSPLRWSGASCTGSSNAGCWSSHCATPSRRASRPRHRDHRRGLCRHRGGADAVCGPCHPSRWRL
jgi:transposase-like protein